MKDGIYFEIFAMNNGVRYNVKIIDIKEVSKIILNSVVDGIEEVTGFKETNHSTMTGGVQE